MCLWSQRQEPRRRSLLKSSPYTMVRRLSLRRAGSSPASGQSAESSHVCNRVDTVVLYVVLFTVSTHSCASIRDSSTRPSGRIESEETVLACDAEPIEVHTTKRANRVRRDCTCLRRRTDRSGSNVREVSVLDSTLLIKSNQ